MPSPVPLASSRSDEVPIFHGPRYGVGVAVGVLLAVVLWPLFKNPSGAGLDAAISGAAVAPSCVRWDDLASEAIAGFVHDGKRDADLQRASDAIFRLRRARRNCNAGWVTLACQDYQVIIQRVPGFTASRPALSSACGTTAGKVSPAGTP